MAILFMDSVQHYVTADMLLKWSAVVNMTVAAGQGRSGDKALSGTGTYNVVKNLPANKSVIYVGWAFKGAALQSETACLQLLNTGAGQIAVFILADGSIRVKRNTSVLGTSSPGLVSAGSWQFIEVKCVFSTSATGSVEIRINGEVVYTLSAVQTANTNAWANQVKIFCSLSTCYICDIYIADDQGGVNDTYLGDVACLCLVPNADGHTTQWTPNSGAVHYDRVNQTTNDNDTTYVSSATVDQIDTVALPNLPATVSTVKAVQWIGTLKKDDATVRKVKPVISDGSSDQLGTEISLTTTYIGYQNPFDVNPLDSNNPWTPAAVDGLQVGVKVTA